MGEEIQRNLTMNMNLILIKIKNLIFYTVYYDDDYNYEAIYNGEKGKQTKTNKIPLHINPEEVGVLGL